MKQIKNFSQAIEFLGNKQERPYAHNTRLERVGDEIRAKYHGNTVAIFRPDETVYSSCGWKTITTKERINWFLPDGFYLYQQNSIWYLANRQEHSHVIFADGLTIDNAGNVTGFTPEDSDETKQTIKAIKHYVTDYIKALLSGKIKNPSAGDCWYCAMVTTDGQNLGDAMKDTDHILSHFEESYYVPSLLMTANTFSEHTPMVAKLSPFSKDGVARLWNGESISEWQSSLVARDVKSTLTTYLKHVLGVAQ